MAGIAGEPAFNWWVGWVIEKQDRIISLVKRQSTRYLKKNHKFGIELPKTVEEALELFGAMPSTERAYSFDILQDGSLPPQDYQFVRCHMVFNVKMEDFRRKARLVAGRHMTKAPATLTYASVVSCKTVRLALTVAALNDIDVWDADVLNTYITATCPEKIWTTFGPKFESDNGKKALVVHALYGLKSSGAAFRVHLQSFMKEMGYNRPVRKTQISG
jgi:hypothetical protein